ncbi:MAG: alpha-galactosidase [Bacteroidaceae bacterium]|nr:alpha-galactosidase [Bacteroidaceae bacterium]
MIKQACFLVAAMFGFISCTEKPVDYTRAESFFNRISSQQNAPLSFKYGEKESAEILKACEFTMNESVDAQGWKVRTTQFTSADNLIYTIVSKIAPDMPVVEWTGYIENAGQDTTQIFADILGADLSLEMKGGEGQDYNFRYSIGSHDGFDDFALCDSVVPSEGGKMYFSGGSGWATSKFLPFVNTYRNSDEGIIVGVGWAGQWMASFTTEGNQLSIESGLEKTHLRLYPGEKIRTPLTMVTFWNNSIVEGHNKLRQYIVKYSSPKPSGKDLVVPVSFPVWGGTTTAHHLQYIDLVKKLDLGYDNYWVDAGWFGGPHPTLEHQDVDDEDWYGVVGNWEVNTVQHPNGLEPISKAAHDAGMNFLLWFEPERAVKGTPVAQEHPEWLMHLPANAVRPKVGKYPIVENYMVNIGHPDAYQWVLDFLTDYIQKLDINIFRNDNNSSPLRYWKNTDTEDRQGMTEIKYIENLYKLLDELQERFPSLLIDNCAGGGHRLELEMLRRSVALHRSDYTCKALADPIGCQLHAFGIMNWIPYSNTGTSVKPYDAYCFRSNMNAGLNFNFLPRNERGAYLNIPDDYPWEWFREMMRQHAAIRDFYNGDYFPLTPFSLELDVWCCYQMYKKETDKGFIMAFRRDQAKEDTFTAYLGDIEPKSTYRFENFDTKEIIELSGKELIEKGFVIKLAEPRSSALIKMEKIK